MLIRWHLTGAAALLFAAAMAAAQQAPAPSLHGPQAPATPHQAAPVPGKQRGVQALTEPATIPHGRHYVVAIGIDHYANWPILGTAVSDATGFAKLLTSQFGFEYAVEPLTEKDATRDAINTLIDDDLRSKLKAEDDLVIFFAGHGTTRKDKVGDTTQSVGFIVPYEARAPGAEEHWSDYLNIEELLRNIGSLPAAHILVIFDSCHSGMAMGNRFVTSRADTRFQRDMLAKISRKVIASAEGDQLAADTGPLPGHSLFTGLLIQGLTTGKADRFDQGFITATQLGAYAQHEVAVAEGSKQTPLFGAFNLDAGGDLIIPLGAGAASTAAAGSDPKSTLTKLETAEIAKIRKDQRHYWLDDDPLKNFPAARSGALKLCDGGDAWGCGQAAKSFRAGLGGDQDYTRAVELARQACGAHLDDACITLGVLYETGFTIQPDLQSAVHLYKDVCSRGDQFACAEVGRVYIDGPESFRNYAAASDLFNKACDAGEMVGCNNLGVSYYYGRGVPLDYAKAAALYTRACDSNYMKGCDSLAYNYLYGKGVAIDLVKARLLYKKACDGGEMGACTNEAIMYQNGNSVAKDDAAAVSYYRRACTGGDMTGCTDLGIAYAAGTGVAKDAVAAASYYRKACDGREMNGCINLGYVYEAGQGVDKDPAEAVNQYRKACHRPGVEWLHPPCQPVPSRIRRSER
jgi:TPR repeat protein